VRVTGGPVPQSGDELLHGAQTTQVRTGQARQTITSGSPPGGERWA
jgi:hypothetical protein